MFYDVYLALCKKIDKKPSTVAFELGINKSNVSNWKNNGYTPRGEALNKIADYFGVTTDYLLGADGKRDYGEEMAGWYSPLRFWDKINENRSDFMHYFMQAWEYPVEDIANLWGVPVDNPEKATDEEFKDFLLSTVKAVRLNPEDGEWDVVIIPQTEKAPTPEGERPITFDDFTYAFYNESKDLPEEKKKMLLDMARFMKADLDKEKGE